MAAARRTRGEWPQRANHRARGEGDDNEKKRADGTVIDARGGGSGGNGGKGAPMGGGRVWRLKGEAAGSARRRSPDETAGMNRQEFESAAFQANWR
jgi:hypothetical protein